jgi:hypothetical protein
MTDTATPVAAWYPDPAGHSDLRWWDGTRWTAEVRSTAQVAELGHGAPMAPQARGTHVAEVAPPGTSTVPLTPEEERAALYAARREAHFREAPVAPSMVPTFGAGDFGARPFGATQVGASEVPDRFRATYEEKNYQAWRKNKAATSALTFAAINLGLLVWALFQHYSPYYRVVPSVIGVVTAIVALRQARETDTGLAKSLVALVVNGVIGLIAAVALLQMLLGFGNAFTFAGPEGFSREVEQLLTEETTELGHATASVVCPEEIFDVAGATYVCEEIHADGTTEEITVEIQTDENIVYWFGR